MNNQLNIAIEQGAHDITNNAELIECHQHAEKKISLTNLKAAENETDKTDETDLIEISNDDFMKRIFGNINDSEYPIVVSFSGNPSDSRKSAWFGKPWIACKTFLNDSHNNYTSLATFKPDDKDNYRRQKKYFAALNAFMLDDIGIKIPIERITLQPSWIIETSPGNYQYGYILDEPITDSAKADSLLESIIEAGLCDTGASGACARLGRLPVAINGKHTNADGSAWRCQLKVWKPELRYSVQQIVDGLQIELKEKKPRSRTSISKGKQPVDHYHDEIYIPRADENPIITALKNSSLYKQPLGDGKHDITCPWVHEHTDQIDHGTAYFEPSDNYTLGGFNCMHGHCSDRRIASLYDFLGISKTEAKHKPIIRLYAGEIPYICDIAESEMAKTLRYYQQGGIIVIISTDPGTMSTTVHSLSLHNLTRALAGIAIWQRFDKRNESWVVCDPPERHIRVLHDSSSYSHLPVLNGIARQPYFRADESLVTNAGYDPESGMFGVFNSHKFDIPQIPTKDQALSALDELMDLLTEFPFPTEHDRSAALSGIITAVIRPSLPQAPMYHVKAPSIASGKSYLCELLSSFATPQKSSPHAFPADDEECRKLLFAELRTSPAVVEFDNLTSDLLPHKSLCTALTSEHLFGRILGQSKTAEVSTRALFLSSGNNVDPIRDMTRRTVTIKLDPGCEMPASRNYLKQPVNEIRMNRERYVSRAIIIVRAWMCANKPILECKPIATFTEWSNYCRQTLLWLGLPDPAISLFEAMSADQDREILGELLKAWFDHFGPAPTSVKDIIDPLTSSDDLREIVQDIASQRDRSIDRKRLGWWIKRHTGQVVNGLRFVKDTSIHNAAKWRVESV